MGNVENCETFNSRSKLQYNAVTSKSSIKKEVLERGKYFFQTVNLKERAHFTNYDIWWNCYVFLNPLTTLPLFKSKLFFQVTVTILPRRSLTWP